MTPVEQISATADGADPISQEKNLPSSRGVWGALRIILIGGIVLVVALARHLGGLAPAPPVSIPSVETLQPAVAAEQEELPEPTFLQAQDFKLETQDSLEPAERTTLLPIPELTR